jgi:hypothetical protein
MKASRKKSSRRGVRRKRRSPEGEAVRVVPMYHPAAVRITAARLTYRGGPLITAAQVFVVFWGKDWGTTTASTELIAKINKFFADILVSPLVDQLSEYDVPGQKIGHGAFLGSKVLTANAPVNSVTDSAIQGALKSWITAKTIPPNRPDNIYFVYLDPGIVSIMGGSRSCQSYCGYHSNSGEIYYGVIPYPGCAGCLGGLQLFDAVTATSSHELCEAITDPVPGTGWYDETNGEIGDICAWNFKQIAGYTVQLEWSNNENKCI